MSKDKMTYHVFYTHEDGTGSITIACDEQPITCDLINFLKEIIQEYHPGLNNVVIESLIRLEE